MDVPPTKSSLRKIRNDLAFAHEGFDLLDQKREILVIEIMKKAADIRAVEEKVRAALENLYATFRATAMDMGTDVLVQKSLSEKDAYGLSMDSYRFIGITIPVVTIEPGDILNSSSMYGTTALYDRCKKQCADLLLLLADYSSLMKTVVLLSRELKKVQRKVNALEKIFIPQNEEAQKYISDRLEEIEREEIFVKKLIRQRNE